MRTFTLIWIGQMASTIGSYMTVFALTVWVWDVTESATTLALISFFSQLPRILAMAIAGIIVDRINRKHLMLLGDTAAVFCTLIIGWLYAGDRLQIWHLYAVVAAYGCFGSLQTLAYSASIAMLVSKQHYTRAESMVAAVSYTGAIISPLLAGSLYPIIGLTGIILIDLATFAIAFITLFAARIPQPSRQQNVIVNSDETLWQKLTFGFRYILHRPSLVAMVIAFSLFALPSDINRVLYNPLILARSGGDAQILGLVTTAAGVGGVLGAVVLSVWGGFHRRIHGMLLGFTATGLFKVILGLGQTQTVWMAAHFLATLPIPLFYSSSNAIWYAKVPPDFQGRVLAADQMIGLIVGAIAPLIAGPLADYVFEPAMQPQGSLAPLFGSIFGTTTGSGIALLYVITAILMLAVGISGYAFRPLREVEILLPDYEEVKN